jgi:hypothetical protein
LPILNDNIVAHVANIAALADILAMIAVKAIFVKFGMLALFSCSCLLLSFAVTAKIVVLRILANKSVSWVFTSSYPATLCTGFPPNAILTPHNLNHIGGGLFVNKANAHFSDFGIILIRISIIKPFHGFVCIVQ